MFDLLLKSMGADSVGNETHFYKFEPKPDITAYEFALILRRFGALTAGAAPPHGVMLMPWETMEEEYVRHFTLADQPREKAVQSSFCDLDCVVLTAPVVSDDGVSIPAGTEGTVVSVHGPGETYVVEFAEPNGALATVARHEIRLAESAGH